VGKGEEESAGARLGVWATPAKRRFITGGRTEGRCIAVAMPEGVSDLTMRATLCLCHSRDAPEPVAP